MRRMHSAFVASVALHVLGVGGFTPQHALPQHRSNFGVLCLRGDAGGEYTKPPSSFFQKNKASKRPPKAPAKTASKAMQKPAKQTPETPPKLASDAVNTSREDKLNVRTILRVPWAGKGPEDLVDHAWERALSGTLGDNTAEEISEQTAMEDQAIQLEPTAKLQAFIARCCEVFLVPNDSVGAQHSQLDDIPSLLETLSTADLGADELVKLARQASNTPGADSAANAPAPAKSSIYYADIYDNEAFSATVFSIPRNTTIPLHSHPNMTIITKVLLGSVNVSTFSLAREDAAPAAGAGLLGGFMRGMGGGRERVLGQLDLAAEDLESLLVPTSGVSVLSSGLSNERSGASRGCFGLGA